jgi:hypothetical protein
LPRDSAEVVLVGDGCFVMGRAVPDEVELLHPERNVLLPSASLGGVDAE